jgi:hypothetical protein
MTDDPATTQEGTPPESSEIDRGGPLPPTSPADIGSASRSCLAILILGTVIVLILCVSLAIRAVS